MGARSSRRWSAVLCLVGWMGTAACGGADSPSAQPADRPAVPWTRVQTHDLVQMLEAKDFTLVNVHVPYEGEIESTDAFVPYDQITERLGDLPGRDGKLVLYCRSGHMSTIAAQALSERGYVELYELSGGFNAWKADGQEIVVDAGRAAGP